MEKSIPDRGLQSHSGSFYQPVLCLSGPSDQVSLGIPRMDFALLLLRLLNPLPRSRGWGCRGETRDDKRSLIKSKAVSKLPGRGTLCQKVWPRALATQPSVLTAWELRSNLWPQGFLPRVTDTPHEVPLLSKPTEPLAAGNYAKWLLRKHFGAGLAVFFHETFKNLLEAALTKLQGLLIPLLRMYRSLSYSNITSPGFITSHKHYCLSCS